MPIMDQRRVAFDVSALRDILNYLPQAAKSVGLPGNASTDIVLDASAKAVRFAFGDHVVSLGAEKMAALLISYCIRADIRIPRQPQRSVSFNQEMITLVFLTEYPAAPLPTFQPPKQMSWNGVRPCGWTESSWGFDRLPGVLILKLGWAEVAQRGM